MTKRSNTAVYTDAGIYIAAQIFDSQTAANGRLWLALQLEYTTRGVWVEVNTSVVV